VSVRLDTPPPAALPDLREQAAHAFDGSRDTPRAARHFVTAMLAQWRCDGFTVDAGLVVAELAANAVAHAGSGFTVNVSAYGDAIRISVGDTQRLAGPDAGLPTVPGHGLSVVAALAAGWGVQEMAGGKAVWAELRSP
jgi:hypothetical protein